MFEAWKKDIAAAMQNDPAARSKAQVFFFYAGVKALRRHRRAHKLWESGHPFLAEWVAHRARRATGIEIHPGAKIAPGVFIDHGSGVVIGETAEVGEGCVLYQGVTLGGTGKDKGKRHPTLERNVMVGAGAKVLGPFTVGEGSKIAAGAVVLSPIPPDSTAVGSPAKVVRLGGVRVCADTDQVHIPDPVAQELCRLEGRIAQLEKKEKKT